MFKFDSLDIHRREWCRWHILYVPQVCVGAANQSGGNVRLHCVAACGRSHVNCSHVVHVMRRVRVESSRGKDGICGDVVAFFGRVYENVLQFAGSRARKPAAFLDLSSDIPGVCLSTLWSSNFLPVADPVARVANRLDGRGTGSVTSGAPELYHLS